MKTPLVWVGHLQHKENDRRVKQALPRTRTKRTDEDLGSDMERHSLQRHQPDEWDIQRNECAKQTRTNKNSKYRLSNVLVMAWTRVLRYGEAKVLHTNTHFSKLCLPKWQLYQCLEQMDVPPTTESLHLLHIDHSYTE